MHQRIAPTEGIITMAATQTTATLATALNTDPRTLRKFLRSEGQGVGKGARYSLPATKREVAALAKKFDAWSEARTAAPSAPEGEDEGTDGDEG